MRKRVIFIGLFLSFLAMDSGGQESGDGTLKIGKSYRIHPGSVSQSEVLITRHPYDQSRMAVACNSLSFIPFFISEGNFFTTDGGTGWSGSDTCNGSPVEFHGGDPGLVIDHSGRVILTRLGRSPFTGLYSHYSTDFGLSWSSQKTLSTDDLERAALATDVIAASPDFGRTYAVYTRLAQPFPIMLVYTDDGAESWSTPSQVNNPVQRSAGGDIAIGPEGKVYACWAGVTSSSPFKEILVGFASSADGGTSWNVTENAFQVNGITGILPEKGNIHVNGLPMMAVDTTHGPRRGWIYIATGQKDLIPAGSDPDIILYRSGDGGQTWSSGIRVNQDPLNNGKIQYFANIHVDHYGDINVLFYDDRTTTSDSAGVFLARSTDGGETWKEVEICDHHFKPAPIGGLGQGYQGDVIDLTSNATRLWPVWMDNSSGIYQVWTVPVEFTDVGKMDEPVSPGHPVLTIHPNPCRDISVIRFSVERDGMVSLELLDIYGKRMIMLDQGYKNSGKYQVAFTASSGISGTSLAGGTYVCRLITPGGTVAKLVMIAPRD